MRFTNDTGQDITIPALDMYVKAGDDFEIPDDTGDGAAIALARQWGLVDQPAPESYDRSTPEGAANDPAPDGKGEGPSGAGTSGKKGTGKTPASEGGE